VDGWLDGWLARARKCPRMSFILPFGGNEKFQYRDPDSATNGDVEGLAVLGQAGTWTTMMDLQDTYVDFNPHKHKHTRTCRYAAL
jgi:hypothetical protein